MEPEQISTTVFVYGTLRREGSNHWRMQAAEFQNTGKTTGKLYHIDWYPGAKFDTLNTELIFGELYSLSIEHLMELDAFEGLEYQRVRIEVETPQEKTSAWAWHYLPEVTETQLIATGDWLSS